MLGQPPSLTLSECWRALAGRRRLRFGGSNQTLSNSELAGNLARAANSFSFLPHSSFRQLFVSARSLFGQKRSNDRAFVPPFLYQFCRWLHRSIGPFSRPGCTAALHFNPARQRSIACGFCSQKKAGERAEVYQTAVRLRPLRLRILAAKPERGRRVFRGSRAGISLGARASGGAKSAAEELAEAMFPALQYRIPGDLPLSLHGGFCSCGTVKSAHKTLPIVLKIDRQNARRGVAALRASGRSFARCDACRKRRPGPRAVR